MFEICIAIRGHQSIYGCKWQDCTHRLLTPGAADGHNLLAVEGKLLLETLRKDKGRALSSSCNEVPTEGEQRLDRKGKCLLQESVNVPKVSTRWLPNARAMDRDVQCAPAVVLGSHGRP